jgi:hypothetical protein
VAGTYAGAWGFPRLITVFGSINLDLIGRVERLRSRAEKRLMRGSGPWREPVYCG